MFRSVLRGLIVASAAAVITGCGGGSFNGGGSTGGSVGSPSTITFHFKGTPAAVAAQIGTGKFSLQTINNNQLTLSIPAGTANFTVAYICSLSNGTLQIPMEFVFELSTADGSAFTGICPTTPAVQTANLATSVDATAIAGATEVRLAATNGSTFALATAVLNGSYNFAAPAGNDRVEVLAYQSGQVGVVSTTTLVAARNLASQPVPGTLNGGDPVVLGPADQPTQQSITYSAIPPGYTTPTTSVGLGLGDVGGFVIAGPVSNQYPVLPAGAVQSGDFYQFYASAANSSRPGEQVIVLENTTTPGPVTLTFPPPWTYAGPTPSALPSFNFSYPGFSGKTGVMQTAGIAWSSANGSGGGFLEVSATASYLKGSTTLPIPDLTALPGFFPAPASGTPVLWTAEIFRYNSGILPASQAGLSASAVANSGTFTVP